MKTMFYEKIKGGKKCVRFLDLVHQKKKNLMII